MASAGGVWSKGSKFAHASGGGSHFVSAKNSAIVKAIKIDRARNRG
jgi:hypothetical protein